MSTKWGIVVLAVSGMLSAAVGAESENSLDIKGFYAGMKRYELKGHLTDFCYLEGCAFSRKTPFTVGGVKGKFNGDGTADLIDFQFDSGGFSSLRAALIAKFPDTKCVESTVITRLGLTVPQVFCAFETGKDGIYLVRVAGSINKSAMFVMSAEVRQEFREHVAETNRDL